MKLLYEKEKVKRARLDAGIKLIVDPVVMDRARLKKDDNGRARLIQ